MIWISSALNFVLLLCLVYQAVLIHIARTRLHNAIEQIDEMDDQLAWHCRHEEGEGCKQ